MAIPKPFGHRVVVKPDVVEDEMKSDGGIVIPILDKKGEQAATSEGVIVRIGPTAWKDPSLGGETWASVGERVFYAKFAGKEYRDPKTNDLYVILNDEDLVFGLDD